MTSREPSRAMLLALVVCAMALAGCGGGGSSVRTGAGGGGFMAQLNGACRADIAATRAAPKTVEAQAAAQRRYIQTLLNLKPTAALKPLFSEYVSVLQQNLAAFEGHNLTAGKRSRAQLARVLAKLRSAGASDCK